MKFADTIVKVYATSSAMLLTMLISVCPKLSNTETLNQFVSFLAHKPLLTANIYWLFGLEPKLQLFVGIIVAAISLQLYFMPSDQPVVEKQKDPLVVLAQASKKNADV